MNPKPDPAQAALRRLLDVMATLRDPVRGCPWDRAQSFATIAPYTIEEAYEAADAIAAGDHDALLGELGDLLFQVVYHARLAEEEGRFGFADVANAIVAKMIRRHPHVVFDPAEPPGGPAPHPEWETQKARERRARAEHATLAGIPAALPALTRAAKLTSRAARAGFDWPDAEAVLEKLAEETAELRAELHAAEPARLADEVGDMLFVLANLARKLGLDPEECARQANRKFVRRFTAMEQAIEAGGQSLPETGLDRMEEAWQAVKKSEREQNGGQPSIAPENQRPAGQER